MEWNLYQEHEKKEILIFLQNNNNIVDNVPISSLSGGIKGMLNLYYKHGNILILRDEDNKKIVGFCGFTYGDVNENFKSKNILYVYLAAILTNYRGVLFLSMIKKLYELANSNSFHTIRFKSPFVNKKNNTLYDKFAKRISKTVNASGNVSILYEITLEEIKNKFNL